MKEIKLWKPVSFNEQTWGCADTTEFDRIAPSWKEYRAKLSEDEGELKRYNDRLKYEHAVETGVVERLYIFDDESIRGITETMIKDGIKSNFLQHVEVENRETTYALIRNQYEAMDGLFGFIKEDYPLSTSYIKQLHAVVTRSQDTTEAITPAGERIRVPLLKGEYKQQENNPVRLNDDVTFKYCPPYETPMEMDNLIQVYNALLINKVHPVIRAAFFHHAFSTIHPFQDGNGRVSRLLTSLILIRDDYFPFSVKPKEREKYLNTLEQADEENVQPFVDFISSYQIRAIEYALDFRQRSIHDSLDAVVDALKYRLEEKEAAKQEEIDKRRDEINRVLSKQTKYMKDILGQKLGCEIHFNEDASTENASQRMTYQMISYAKEFKYFMKKNMPWKWSALNFTIGEQRFKIILFIHHFGQTDDAVAIGGVLEAMVKGGRRTDYIRQAWSGDVNIIPLEVPPLKLSLLANLNEKTKTDIQRHVELLIKVAIAGVISEI